MSKEAVFIAGTDTSIGKTVISKIIIQYLQAKKKTVCGFKPIASGAELVNGILVNDDAIQLQSAGSVKLDYGTINPFVYELPVAPNIAARGANRTVDLSKIQQCYEQIKRTVDYVVVEGVGGWRSPITDNFSSVDLVRSLKIPVILVVGLRLGCINHALLTAESMMSDKVNILGWIANGPWDFMLAENEVCDSLEHLLSIPCIGRVHNIEMSSKPALELDLSFLL